MGKPYRILLILLSLSLIQFLISTQFLICFINEGCEWSMLYYGTRITGYPDNVFLFWIKAFLLVLAAFSLVFKSLWVPKIAIRWELLLMTLTSMLVLDASIDYWRFYRHIGYWNIPYYTTPALLLLYFFGYFIKK